MVHDLDWLPLSICNIWNNAGKRRFQFLPTHHAHLWLASESISCLILKQCENEGHAMRRINQENLPVGARFSFCMQAGHLDKGRREDSTQCADADTQWGCAHCWCRQQPAELTCWGIWWAHTPGKRPKIRKWLWRNIRGWLTDIGWLPKWGSKKINTQYNFKNPWGFYCPLFCSRSNYCITINALSCDVSLWTLQRWCLVTQHISCVLQQAGWQASASLGGAVWRIRGVGKDPEWAFKPASQGRKREHRSPPCHSCGPHVSLCKAFPMLDRWAKWHSCTGQIPSLWSWHQRFAMLSVLHAQICQVCAKASSCRCGSKHELHRCSVIFIEQVGMKMKYIGKGWRYLLVHAVVRLITVDNGILSSSYSTSKCRWVFL